MGLFGPPNVANLEARRDIKGLVQALLYEINRDFVGKYDSVRQAAADALVRLSASAVGELIKALVHAKEDKECLKISEVLIRIGAPAVQPLILTLLTPEYARRSAEILGEIGDIQAVQPMLRAAITSGGGFDDDILQAIVKIGEPAVAPLEGMLQDPNPLIREAAVDTLSRIGLPSLNALFKALRDNELTVQVCAARGLGRIGTSAEEAILDAYQQASSLTRQKIVEICHLLPSGCYQKILKLALSDGDESVRQTAHQSVAYTQSLASTFPKPIQGPLMDVEGGTLQPKKPGYPKLR